MRCVTPLPSSLCDRARTNTKHCHPPPPPTSFGITDPNFPVRRSCSQHGGPGLACYVFQAFGTAFIGFQQAWVDPLHTLAPSLTGWEHHSTTLCQVATYVVGLRYVGWRFLPRMLLSVAIMSYVTITLFMVSHIGPRELDGPRHAAESRGDWGEYQLRTAVGWGYEWGACASVPFLLVNHQPLHHLFPALHHSRLPSLVPLVREAYPGLLADEPGLGAFVQAFREMYETVFSSTAGERAWAHVYLPTDGGGHENERADEREGPAEEEDRVCSVCDECDSSGPCCQCQFAIRHCCAGK